MDDTCNQISGQCTCKKTTTGLTCSSCKPGYFDYPQNALDECEKCWCDVGGALSEMCDQASGKKSFDNAKLL